MMTRQQEVQELLNRISNYIAGDDAVLTCNKVKKAEAFITLSDVCENLKNDRCEEVVKNILMEEIP
jgi:hypothetical protein